MGNKEEMTMTYSGIVVSDGKKKISVTFTVGDAYAEASIPDCKVIKSTAVSAICKNPTQRYPRFQPPFVIAAARIYGPVDAPIPHIQWSQLICLLA